MSMFRRRIMMQESEGGFPSNLQKLEWIKNPSDAYIDTGILAQSGLSIEIKFYSRATTPKARTLIGAQKNYYEDVLVLDLKGIYVNLIYDNINNVKSATFDNYGEPILFKSEGNLASVQQGSDNMNLTVSPATFKGKCTLCLFMLNANGVYSNIGEKITMYYCKISKDGTELRNFIPCKDINTQDIGMYDLVEGKFYKSPNGTKFIGG